MSDSTPHISPHEIAQTIEDNGFVLRVGDESGPYAHPDSVIGRQIRLARAYLDLEEQLSVYEGALQRIADDTEPNHYSRFQGIAKEALGG